MTPTKQSFILLLTSVTSLCFLGSSCVHYTTFPDEQRRKVSFSSVKAAQTFYDAYASVGTPYGNGELKVTLFAVYPPYWHSKKPKENIKFNAAVESADSNGNNFISEKEAQVYSATIAEGRKNRWEATKI